MSKPITPIATLPGSVDSQNRLQVNSTLASSLTSATLANPGAGQQISLPVTSGETWRLQSVAATFTTSGVAGSRVIGWNIKDATGNIVYQFKLPVQTFAASKTVLFSVGIGGLSQSVADQVSMSALPDILMGSGWTFNTVVSSGDAGDAWSAIAYSYIKA